MKSFIKIFIIAFVFLSSQYAILADEKVKVDYTSDLTYMLKKGDTTVMKLVGSVYFYHNDAIINCDTAYYYIQSDKFEGIGNVIINQDSIYVYGDRVVYSKNNASARVFAPLIKVVDSATVMYTRNLIYNTNTSIGEYFGGATVEHNSNTLESWKGFYDSQKSLVMLRDSVAIHNEDYTIKTDSVDFYLDTEELDYDCRSYIWRSNGDFLQSDKGRYLKNAEMFQCEKNSYVLTKEQEIWADSIKYYTKIEEAILNRNIQIMDTVKKMYAFGDYGQYWKIQKNILMTQNPTVINYTENGDKVDSVFLSSDTLFIRPFIPIAKFNLLDSVAKKQHDEIAIDKSIESRFSEEVYTDVIDIEGNSVIDTLSTITDSLSQDMSVVDTVSQNVSAIDSLRQIVPVADSLTIDTLPQKLDSVQVYDVTKVTKKEIDLMTKVEYKSYKKKLREHRKLIRKEKYLKWLQDGGMVVEIDTVTIDSTNIITESLLEGSGQDSINNFIEIENVADSSDYIIRGYANSRIFRSDVQLICDTIISETVDSTTTFIGSPIIWNSNNQITAKRIRSYSMNQQLYRSRLFGSPIIAQEVLPGKFSQLSGKTMDAMFKNNSIYRLYINQDADALIYKEKESDLGKTGELENLIHAKSVNAIVDFDSMEMSVIKFFTDITTITYPMDKIPDNQILELPNFKWKADLRPTKKDVFDRVVRKSYRSDAIMVVQPIFGITSAIEKEKKQLSEKKVWRDRTELIPSSKKRFMGFN